MPKFLFKFKDGAEETVEMSDCPTVEHAVNTKCGSNTVGLESCTLLDEGTIDTAAVAEVAEVAEKPAEEPAKE